MFAGGLARPPDHRVRGDVDRPGHPMLNLRFAGSPRGTPLFGKWRLMAARFALDQGGVVTPCRHVGGLPGIVGAPVLRRVIRRCAAALGHCFAHGKDCIGLGRASNPTWSQWPGWGTKRRFRLSAAKAASPPKPEVSQPVRATRYIETRPESENSPKDQL